MLPSSIPSKQHYLEDLKPQSKKQQEHLPQNDSLINRHSDDPEAQQTHTSDNQNGSIPAVTTRLQAAVPISISGIVGVYGSYVNGIYLPTDEFQNDWPIYRRVADSQASPLEFQEMFLCFEIPPIPFAGVAMEESKQMKSAWVIKNTKGIIYARCRLPNVENQKKIPPERIQFHGQGMLLRQDLCWEMRSSVDVFGFRKRFGGVMRPASFFQLRSQPELKEEMFEISKPLPRDSRSPSHPLEDLLHPQVLILPLLFLLLDS